MKLLFPLALIAMNLGASLTYYCTGDYKRGTYWLAATVLNVCITL